MYLKGFPIWHEIENFLSVRSPFCFYYFSEEFTEIASIHENTRKSRSTRKIPQMETSEKR